jgi:acetyl esterase/lipase
VTRRGHAMRSLLPAAAVGLALAVAAGGASARSAAGCALGSPIGTGAAQSWLVRSAAQPLSVVIFAHGWTATDPSGWHLARMAHLCERGSAVVFPRYQRGDYTDSFEGSVAPFRRGLEAAFQRLGPSARRLPVVAAGFSFGATLALYYAAEARRWHLPPPAAVYSIFPAEPIPGVSLPPFPRSTRYVLLAGSDDEVVGRRGADAFWRLLRGHPTSRKQYRLIRTRAGLVASHLAPVLPTPAAVRVFWEPLDALVAVARARG